MRILLVSHDFLPKHPAGTEIYTFQLAQHLRNLGHDAHVFTTEKEISRPNLAVHLRHYLGVPVHELTNNLFYNQFDETWNYPPVERSFSIFLDDFKPDVVHFMHLMYLSIGCVEDVHRRGLPVFFTLHDYWLQCARFGQRLHFDRSICHTIDFARCGQCLERFKFAQTRTQRAAAKGLALLRTTTGLDLGPLARSWVERLLPRTDRQVAPNPVAAPVLLPAESAGLGQLGCGAGHSNPAGSNQAGAQQDLTPAQVDMMGAVARRDVGLRQRLLPVVDRFIAPSHFLRDSFIDWGIPEEQILYMRTGIDLDHFQSFVRRPSPKVRFGFIGTVVPHKGVHILLQAWQLLSPDLRARAELKIFGPTHHTPDYVRAVEQLAERAGLRLGGMLARDEVPRALEDLDVLVVPSVWYENSPLIILEGLITRTPLLVSNLGGMAELVQHGEHGYTFEVGSAEDLARYMAEFIEEPERLSRFYGSTRPVRGVAEDAQQLLDLYAAAREKRLGDRAGARLP
jgi:glycosyltransferase involved in cell wall biosynthesis